MSSNPVRVGVIGLGSVFDKYGRLLMNQVQAGSAEVVDVFDVDTQRQDLHAARFAVPSVSGSADALIRRSDIDAVVVLTSMQQHGDLAIAAYEAGKHILVEKPMATTLEQAARLVELSKDSDRRMVCAPHVLLSPTYRSMYDQLKDGVIGEVKLARALYGWAGPWWGQWFYKPGGGALFDLGCYNFTSLCGFLGSVKRVTALVGTAIKERIVDGEMTQVEVDDNAHVLLDFGNEVYGSVTTGFTIQKYGHAPAIELFGLSGSMNMLGDDWAPRGFERWRNEANCWELFEETDPNWPWADGLNHLIDCIQADTPTVTRPEHAYHVLEVMLAAQESSRLGRAVDIESDFPAPQYPVLAAADSRRLHDPS